MRGELSAIGKVILRGTRIVIPMKATSLSSTRVGTLRSPINRCNEATFANQSVVARH